MPFKRREMLNTLLGLSLMLILTGCTTMTGSGATDTTGPATTLIKGDRKPVLYCGAIAPVRWSQSDTANTIRQIKIHNAKWQALCGTDRRPMSNVKAE